MTDRELIDGYLQREDHDCIALLMERHYLRVRRVVFSMISNENEVDDAVQEVFFRVLRSLASFQGRSAFSTWLYRIAINTTYQYLQKQKRDHQRNRYLSDQMISQHGSPEAKLIREELNSEIRQAIQKLNPEIRGTIILHCIEGLRPDEIAQIQKCNRATIYWRIHKGRKLLRAAITESVPKTFIRGDSSREANPGKWTAEDLKPETE